MNHRAEFVRPRHAGIAFFILIFLGGACVCRAEDFGDISAMAGAMYTGATYHGYAARRITLENRSDHTSHVVTLNYPNNSYGNYGNCISRLTRSVTLAPRAIEVVTLFQPPLPINGSDNIGVDIDGGHAGEIRAPNANSHCSTNYGSYGSTGWPTAFISRSLDYDAVCHVLNAGTPTAPGSGFAPVTAAPAEPSGAVTVEGLRSEVPADQWSDDWLAYTPFDVVVLKNTDLSSLAPEAADAIRSYVSAGGSLIVFGSDGVPEAWRAGNADPFRGGEYYTNGLGHIFVLDSTNSSVLRSQTIDMLRKNLSGNFSYWQALPNNDASMNDSLNLVKNLQVPTRGIIALMLVFVIVIGPVNILVLNRRKRRTWMLWTIPAIAVTTTFLIFAYSYLREGFTPTVRITGFTLLDQSSHHADTIGAEGIYCPLTPGGGLHFDAETEVTPMVAMDYSSPGSSREIEWSHAQHFTSGWMAARVPAFFHLRKSETCRERVQIENKDGHLEVLNGLGAPIKSIWYADADRKMYEAHDIAPGATAELTALNSPTSDTLKGPTALFRSISFVGHHLSPPNSAADYLTPNTYIADLDSNPFLENALGPGASVKLTKTSAVVFGILDPSDHL